MCKARVNQKLNAIKIIEANASAISQFIISLLAPRIIKNAGRADIPHIIEATIGKNAGIIFHSFSLGVISGNGILDKKEIDKKKDLITIFILHLICLLKKNTHNIISKKIIQRTESIKGKTYEGLGCRLRWA